MPPPPTDRRLKEMPDLDSCFIFLFTYCPLVKMLVETFMYIFCPFPLAELPSHIRCFFLIPIEKKLWSHQKKQLAPGITNAKKNITNNT